MNEGKTFHGSIVIENDRIAEVIADGTLPLHPCDEEIDAGGCYLMPGVIDDHVHFRDPGLTHKADMHTESTAAAAGGVTSFMDMPNTTPQTTNLEALEAKFADAATKSVVNYSFYFGATNNNADMLSQLDKTRICGVKLFMGASTGNMLVDRMEVLRKVFANAGMLIATHCEEQAIISANTVAFKEKYGEDPDIKYHPEIRSAEACMHSSSLAIKLAEETGARLHILHVSTAGELDLFEDKPLSEKQITSEACVSHLYFCDKDYETLGARIKCNPAIKTATDREALRQALATNRIDVIGTDHAPHTAEEKEKGAAGMVGLETAFGVCYTKLCREQRLPLELLSFLMSAGPAAVLGLADHKGMLAPGYDADVVLVDLDHMYEVSAEDLHSKSKNCPYDGALLYGKVVTTIKGGKVTFQIEE